MPKLKTFIENRWFIRIAPSSFQEIPRDETDEGPSLDVQVNNWINLTRNEIIHPGQLGMHTSWHGDEEDAYKIKCLTLGLTILYQEPGDGGRNDTERDDERRPEDIEGS